MIDVSVIVPVYNAGRYLKECLDSIQRQTLKNIEIVCVNDGSIDNSREILEEYQNQDERFIVIDKQHEEGKGAGMVRNMGLKHASGKYVIFLDADDFFEENMLEETFYKAEETKAQAVIFNAFVYDDKTKQENRATGALVKEYLPDKQVFSGTEAAETLFQITWGGAWNILFLHNYIEEKHLLFQSIRYTDDQLFVYLALAEADRITVLDKYFVHYRSNIDSSQTAGRFQYFEIMYGTPVALKKELDKRGLFEQYKVTFYNRIIPHIIDFLLNQQEYVRFKECYELIKGKLESELELSSYLRLGNDKVYAQNYYYEYKYIVENEFPVYLFMKNRQATLLNGYSLPDEIRGKRIIIYGAGNYGKMLYGRIWETGVCRVVGWVDQKYEVLGYPVQSPKVVEDLSYDYILISIMNDCIVDEVIQFLADMGVEQKRILTLCNKSEEMKGMET